MPPVQADARRRAPTAGRSCRNRTHMFTRLRVPDHRQGGHRLAARQQSRSPRSRTATTRSTPPSTWSTPGSTTGSTRPSPTFVRYAFDNQFTPSGGPTNAASSIVDNSKSHSIVGGTQLGAVAEHGQHPARALPGPQPVHRADQLRPADLPAVVHLRPERRGAAVFSAQDRQLLRDLLHQHPAARHQDRRRVHARVEQLRGPLHRARRLHLPGRHAVQRRRFRAPGPSPSSSRRPASTTTRPTRLPPSCRTTGASPIGCG